MKTKQEMKIRSLYMPETIWNGIDAFASKEDLSANQVIRKIMSSWLLGFLVEKKEAHPCANKSARRESAAKRTLR